MPHTDKINQTPPAILVDSGDSASPVASNASNASVDAGNTALSESAVSTTAARLFLSTDIGSQLLAVVVKGGVAEKRFERDEKAEQEPRAATQEAEPQDVETQKNE